MFCIRSVAEDSTDTTGLWSQNRSKFCITEEFKVYYFFRLFVCADLVESIADILLRILPRFCNFPPISLSTKVRLVSRGSAINQCVLLSLTMPSNIVMGPVSVLSILWAAHGNAASMTMLWPPTSFLMLRLFTVSLPSTSEEFYYIRSLVDFTLCTKGVMLNPDSLASGGSYLRRERNAFQVKTSLILIIEWEFSRCSNRLSVASVLSGSVTTSKTEASR